MISKRIVRSALNGGSFCDPNPHIHGKNMNKNMAPKVPNLPCFEAFGVEFCPDVCSYFCLVCGGAGVTSVFLTKHKSPLESSEAILALDCAWF